MLKSAEKKFLGALLVKVVIAVCVYLYYDSMLAMGTTFNADVIVTQEPHERLPQDMESRDPEIQQLKTKCTNVQPPHLTMTSQTWVPVADDKRTYIFSAYYMKSKNRGKVVIVGAQSGTDKYICQIWHRNNTSGEVELKDEVPTEVNNLPEGHLLRYTARLYYCWLPSDEIPLYISMVSTYCEAPSYLLSVARNIVPEAGTRKFTICLSPLNSMYSRAYELVEWIELNRILGAEKIIVYNNSVADNVAEVLKFYTNRGIAEVVNWQLPMGSDIHYFGQVAALNDCLYRNKNKSKFVVNIDLDEFIIPHLKQTMNWSDMLTTVDDSADVFLFRNTYFSKDWTDGVTHMNKNMVDKYKLVTLQKVEHEAKFYIRGIRSKYIARTETVSRMMIHEVRNYPREYQVNSVTVPVDTAYLHHYRMLDSKESKRVVDTTVPDKFGELLISNVQKVWADLKDVPMDA